MSVPDLSAHLFTEANPEPSPPPPPVPVVENSHSVLELAASSVNFAVRPHRRTVERFGQRNEWITATIDDLDGARALAGLPSTKAPEDVDTEEAKRFDVLLLQLQLALLQADPSFLPLRKRVVEIADEVRSGEKIVVDTRSHADVHTGTVAGDVNVPGIDKSATYSAWVFDPETDTGRPTPHSQH